MNADGSGIAQLTSGGDDHMHPDWSPGGTQIAFAASPCTYYYGCQAYAIHVVRSNGTNVAPVTGRYGSDPDWQP
jgi:Tol biopolymer transport system component